MKDYRNEEAGIYLRMMTRDDTEQIVAWRNLDEIRERFIYRGAFTKEIHENWIKNKIETGQVIQLMICDIATDEAFGSVYIRDIDREHQKAEYGIFIGAASARGRGVGTATAKLMLQFCFEEVGLHRVYLRALSDNLQAIRSYEKAGFVQEGLLRDDVFLDGSYRDVVWMAAVQN